MGRVAASGRRPRQRRDGQPGAASGAAHRPRRRQGGGRGRGLVRPPLRVAPRGPGRPRRPQPLTIAAGRPSPVGPTRAVRSGLSVRRGGAQGVGWGVTLRFGHERGRTKSGRRRPASGGPGPVLRGRPARRTRRRRGRPGGGAGGTAASVPRDRRGRRALDPAQRRHRGHGSSRRRRRGRRHAAAPRSPPAVRPGVGPGHPHGLVLERGARSRRSSRAAPGLVARAPRRPRRRGPVGGGADDLRGSERWAARPAPSLRVGRRRHGDGALPRPGRVPPRGRGLHRRRDGGGLRRHGPGRAHLRAGRRTVVVGPDRRRVGTPGADAGLRQDVGRGGRARGRRPPGPARRAHRRRARVGVDGRQRPRSPREADRRRRGDLRRSLAQGLLARTAQLRVLLADRRDLGDRRRRELGPAPGGGREPPRPGVARLPPS